MKFFKFLSFSLIGSSNPIVSYCNDFICLHCTVGNILSLVSKLTNISLFIEPLATGRLTVKVKVTTSGATRTSLLS